MTVETKSEARIVARKDGAIGWLIFDNPARRNAVSVGMWQAIPRVLEDFGADPAIRVVVLAGAGDKAFVSGADISQFEAQRASAEAVRRYEEIGDAAQSKLQGFDKPTIEFARSAAVPIVPGIATASELQAAWNFGLEFVKVFPASTIGGPPALRMLASICPGMRFMPTGGIGVDDLADYLAIPAVLACGGTWLASASAIAERDFDGIARRAAAAVAIARQALSTR